jgi:imidazole glycerol-phosphate synthase subunit HisH
MIKKPVIVIIDYGMGNIRSIMNKINRAGHEAIVSYEQEVIRSADKIILPGVGHFLNGMKRLGERNIIDILNEKVLIKKTPILGICLGMQLLTGFSEEGNTEGLGWLDAETIKFKLTDIKHKVPHMGWNSIEQKKESPLLKGIPDNRYYYFVHSYHVKCNVIDDVLTTSQYGYEFVSSVQKENIFGTQFHPEKSHEYGEQIIRNFLNM